MAKYIQEKREKAISSRVYNPPICRIISILFTPREIIFLATKVV
jgi:hypothetical protein